MNLARQLALSIRNTLPRSIRHILRLGRHVVSNGRPSLSIPAELLVECRFCASRDELIRVLPHGGRIAEVGTDRGRFAKKILAICDPAELHLIDLDVSGVKAAVARDRRVTMHRGRSHEVLAGLPNAYFDWVYIDADHSYVAVTRDSHAAAIKVKPGGFLVFNDFAHIDPYLGTYGVHRAVVQFAVEQGWRFAWFAYHPSALYDVALQRPPAN
jgi:Methyltransferase domain